MSFWSATVSAAVMATPFPLKPYRGEQIEGQFVFMNEMFDALYRPATSSMRGAGISTGTMRVFQKILYGNFKWFFVVDINDRVKAFNELNAQTILNSTRKEYLENFPDSYWGTYGVFPPGYDQAMSQYTDGKARPLFASLHSDERYLPSRRDAEEMGWSLDQMYFNSDQAYAEMQRKLRSTKLVSITNTVTSAEVAEKIAAFLKEQRVPLDLVDLSNIMDYVIKDRAQSQLVADFIRILAPSKVFFTISLPDREPYQRLLGNELEIGQNIDTFRYYVSSPESFIELVENRPAFSGTKPQLLMQTGELCNRRVSKKKRR